MNHELAEELITDSNFQQLKYKQEKANVFTVVGQTHTEHWHSSFISWLLDPNSSMGLGHFPVARLISLAIIHKPDCGFSLRDLFELELDDLHFETEKTFKWNGGKRSIDIYGESEELIIVIENKVNARENFNNSERGQTQDYYDYVEQHKKPGQRVLYFFITPDPGQKCYSDQYIKILYQELYDKIIAKCIQHPQIKEQSRYLLEQYSSNLRELVHDAFPMALVNYDLCNELNKSYKDVLSEIFNAVSRNDGRKEEDRIAIVLYNHYKSIFDEIFLTLVEDYGMTPGGKTKRKVATFTDLYLAGLISENTRYTLEVDGHVFYAKTIGLTNGEYRLQLLKDYNTPYTDERGNIIGVYKTHVQAALDAVNIHRKGQGKEPVDVIRGSVCWKNEKGVSIQELIDRL